MTESRDEYVKWIEVITRQRRLYLIFLILPNTLPFISTLNGRCRSKGYTLNPELPMTRWPTAWCVVRYLITPFHIQGGPEKNARSSMHHIFTVVGNKVTRLTPKCSAINR